MPFITFEGLDGSGKSTQLNLLHQKLSLAGHEVLCTKEAGGTPLGAAVRNLVQMRQDITIHPLTEALLYAADRAQHVSELVRPALASGVYVLCDRYIDSSLAFQGAVLPVELVRDINRLATAGLQPELTILLDVDVTTSRQRLIARNVPLDRIETRDEPYHDTVRSIYLSLAREEPQRFLVLPAAQSISYLADTIWNQVVKRFFQERR